MLGVESLSETEDCVEPFSRQAHAQTRSNKSLFARARRRNAPTKSFSLSLSLSLGFAYLIFHRVFPSLRTSVIQYSRSMGFDVSDAERESCGNRNYR